MGTIEKKTGDKLVKGRKREESNKKVELKIMKKRRNRKEGKQMTKEVYKVADKERKAMIQKRKYNRGRE